MGIAYGVTTNFQATKGIVQDGLVLNLDAAVDDSYSDGTVWRDLAGGNNGTLTNGPTFNKEKGGNIVFDGSNDYVQLDSSTLTLVQNFTSITISFWFTIDTTSNNCFIATKGGGTNGWKIYRDASSVNRIKVATGNANYSSVGTPLLGISSTDWKNACLVSNSSRVVELYVNGVSDGTYNSGSALSAPGTSDLSLRIGHQSASEYHSGKFSQLQIYNRTLTATEVLQNYNVMKHRFGI